MTLVSILRFSIPVHAFARLGYLLRIRRMFDHRRMRLAPYRGCVRPEARLLNRSAMVEDRMCGPNTESVELREQWIRMEGACQQRNRVQCPREWMQGNWAGGAIAEELDGV